MILTTYKYIVKRNLFSLVLLLKLKVKDLFAFLYIVFFSFNYFSLTNTASLNKLRFAISHDLSYVKT